MTPESLFSASASSGPRKDDRKKKRKKNNFSQLCRVVEAKLHQFDKQASSSIDQKESQENPTGTSPIPAKDMFLNKFFDFSSARIDLKKSQHLQNKRSHSPGKDIAFKGSQ
uniref:Uncharacterized protein n=1 Tax=Euplotes crassus TaxID=5936 RepID=A0A7S3KUY3_EUPCR|mmetsp:Transcript_9751/g.9586  ORF Transcript_9751/g.9586 Transcript_9751/m.9586 type:complete len:111 (+) Transcript_9751:524-856(+)